MRLGRKVEHRPRLVLDQQTRDQFGIGNVTLHKHMAGITRQAGQGFQVARVGQLVEVDDGLSLRLGQPVQHEIAAYKTGTAGHHNGHGLNSKKKGLGHQLSKEKLADSKEPWPMHFRWPSFCQSRTAQKKPA